MKKAFSDRRKLLFVVSSLLFPVMGVTCMRVAWAQPKTSPYTIELPNSIILRGLEFSPDSRRVVISTVNTKTESYSNWVYDLASRSKVCDLKMPPSSVKQLEAKRGYYGSISWSSDGSRLVANSLTNIVIWDARNGQVKADYRYPTAEAMWIRREIRFSPDGKTLIGSDVPPLRYDAATGKRLSDPNSNLDINSWYKSNEKLGLTAIKKGRMRFEVVDSRTKKVVWKPNVIGLSDFWWHGDILCLKDGDSWSYSEGPIKNLILLWDAKTRKLLPSPPLLSAAQVGGIGFKLDGRTMAYSQMKIKGSRGNITEYQAELIAWDYRANRVIWRCQTTAWLEYLEWSPDGKWLYGTGASDGGPTQIFAGSGKLQFEREDANFPITWSSDSKQLAMNIVKKDESGRIASNRIEIIPFEN